MDKKHLFKANQKLSDLIEANHNLILMLPRFGIPLGFGDKSVEEICQQYRIPTSFFLLICNVYSFDNYIPDKKNIEETNMDLLVPYLLASHRYYLNDQLPHIEQHLTHIANKSEQKYGNILKQFFVDYKKEVSEHFNYEESIVFPYLNKLQQGINDNTYKINQFILMHSNIEDKLNDLTQIIYKYLPGNVLPSESIELVFDILHLSSDLDKHTLIEDKILVSYVQTLEQKFQ